MKKLLLAAGVVLATALVLVGLASANGGPHGGFTSTTDACAGCHRVHTAQAPRLLIMSEDLLCESCHGSAGTGANTNVEDGYFLSTRNITSTTGVANTANNGLLLAGGFTNYNGVAVTSKHDADDSTSAAWGFSPSSLGGTRGVTATMLSALSCASCHNPHGSPNYRIVQTKVNSQTLTIAQVDEGAAKDYDTEQWGAGQSQLCKACHGAYHRTAPGQGSMLDGGTYTHRVDMPYTFGSNVNPETTGVVSGTTTYKLPLASSGADSDTTNLVVCQTCHLPHGTSAAMGGFANGGALPGNTSATDSALLRLDNRGVCQVCHQK